MRTWSRGIVLALLLAALAVATGFVMVKNRRMSLFLESRDRIERGESREGVLASLATRIDWLAEDSAFARRVAAEALAAPAPVATLHRAGDWALLTLTAGDRRLLVRDRTGWREIP